MSWSSPESWLTRLFSGDLIAIAIAFLVSLSLPLLVHIYFYTTSKKAAVTPSFVLLGPSGAGKTSLLNLLQSPTAEDVEPPSPTRMTQVSSSPVTLSLPPSITVSSNKYRSEHDDSSLVHTPYSLIDTPGHGKLRASQALHFLTDPSLRGVIFMVDASSIDAANSASTRDAANYLHDVLLQLQRRGQKGTQKSRSAHQVSVLVAANKQDLFTALPPGAVRQRLETEIERIKISRSRGLLTVGEKSDEEPEESLGGNGEEPFTFKLLKEEYNVTVDVIGGAAGGEEAGKGVRRWEEWIGGCL